MNSSHPQNLVDPFAQIFTDRAEADWAFDFLRETVKGLGIRRGAYDSRFALTLTRRSGQPCLHLNFGGWLVAGFCGPGAAHRVELTLLADRVVWEERLAVYPFDRKEGQPEVRTYHLPLELINPLTGDLRAAYEASLAFIAAKFEHWQRPSHWQQHQPELVEALFDPDKRAQLFAGLLLEPGLSYERHFTAFHNAVAEEGEEYELDASLPDESTLDRNFPLENVFQPVDLPGDKRILMNQMDEGFEQNLKAAYAEFQNNLQDRFIVKLRRKRAEQLRLFLSKPESVDLETFNREVWLPNSGAYLRGEKVGNYESDTFNLELIPQMDRALESGELELHGNHMWGTASQIYAPKLKDDSKKVEYIRQALNILNDSNLSPLQKFEEITEIYGFGNNISTGLVMVFHPTQFGIYNEQGKRMLKKLGYDTVESISSYEETLYRLKEMLGMKDFLELDWFLYRLVQGRYPKFPPKPVNGPGVNPPYPLPRLAADTGFEEADLTRWLRAIERKKQAIIYGPPGTGKTFIAAKLADHLIGGGDGFVDLVQFHPAYAYEDFIQGIRPEIVEGHLSYQMVSGRFLEFCRRAEGRDTCVLIIDEINRANLARVLGELMYLLEYRDQEIPLAGGDRFKIPANVRLIGTMNTADRSIALVDHALRRRFAFIELKPNFEVLRSYHRLHNPTFPIEAFINELERLNQEIDDENYAVGVTFFLHDHLADHLADIWQMEIEPYLKEYFFNQPDKFERFRWKVIEPRLK